MGDESAKFKYQEAFLNLKRVYLKRLSNSAHIIDDIMMLFAEHAPTYEDFVRIQALVHGLAGSGATFGFPEITGVGREADHYLEIVLKDMKFGDTVHKALVEDLKPLLLDVKKVCLQICEQEKELLAQVHSETVYQVPGVNGQAHILVVEDDRDVAHAIKSFLEAQGMSVQILGRGDEALHYIARTIPNMIILDLMLADMDGLELLQQIHQNSEFYDIPLLVLATRHTDEQRNLCLKLGAFGYMPKPVDLDAMTQKIQARLKDEQGLKQAL